MKFKTILLSVAALLCAWIMFIACGGGATNTAANNAKANTPANTTSTTNTTKANDVATAPAGDSVGVPECDDYIKKYEACLTKIAAKAPQVEIPMKQAFETARNGWKSAAATPQGKATLASACKQAADAGKTSTAAYSCDWAFHA